MRMYMNGTENGNETSKWPDWPDPQHLDGTSSSDRSARFCSLNTPLDRLAIQARPLTATRARVPDRTSRALRIVHHRVAARAVFSEAVFARESQLIL